MQGNYKFNTKQPDAKGAKNTVSDLYNVLEVCLFLVFFLRNFCVFCIRQFGFLNLWLHSPKIQGSSASPIRATIVCALDER